MVRSLFLIILSEYPKRFLESHSFPYDFCFRFCLFFSSSRKVIRKEFSKDIRLFSFRGSQTFSFHVKKLSPHQRQGGGPSWQTHKQRYKINKEASTFILYSIIVTFVQHKCCLVPSDISRLCYASLKSKAARWI